MSDEHDLNDSHAVVRGSLEVEFEALSPEMRGANLPSRDSSVMGTEYSSGRLDMIVLFLVDRLEGLVDAA